MTRQEAREAILAAAEKDRLRLPAHIRVHVAPKTMRHINRAVFKVRRRGLVSGDVLEAAGFRRTA